MTIFYTPQGSDFQVNTTTASAQDQPTVTALAGGGYLVTWAHDSGEYITDENGFTYPKLVSVGQLFDAAGNALGGEFPVGGMTVDDFGYGVFTPPVVTELASGGFVAIWRPDAASSAVAQIYGATGAPVGSTFELPNVNFSVFTADSLPSGGFVVTSLFNQSVLTQTYDSEGTAQDVHAFSESATYYYLPAPTVTSLPSGGFVVSYARDINYGVRYDLVAQVFQADGTAVASEFVVAGDLDGEGASPPTLTSLASGGFVISWAASSDPLLYSYDQIDVMAQIYDAAGNALGAAFMVHSETPGYQQLPDITALSTGGFVVAWSEDGSLNGRVFDAVGNMVGGEFLVTSDMAGTYPSSPLSISALTSGDFVVAWTDLSGDGSGTSVRSQIFTQTDVYSGTSGNEALFGTPGDDQIDGLGGNDYLIGLAGDDVLNGGNGNDRFEGGDGNDTLNGGAGVDGVTYINSTAGVVVDLPNNSAQTSDGVFSDTLSSIEDVSGSEFQDFISGNDSNNVLSGRGGNDLIYGNGGNDRLRSGSGADEMGGGTGNDSYEVDDAGDMVIEAFGEGTADRVDASISYTLGDHVERLTLTGSAAINGTGNALANVIVGNGADNFLFGFDGNDSLNGGLGADTLEGGIGNDVYFVDNAGDTVTEIAGQGNDLVKSSVDYTLGADVERLTLTGTGAISGTGNAGANILTGNGGANTLNGEGRNDRLSGGAGNDQLHGGVGSDRLTGGTGQDGFYFDTALNARNNVDTILDFSAADDTIYLGATAMTLDLGTLAEGAFVNGTAAADADDRIIYDSATGKIYYDADGNGSEVAVLFAQVTAGTALTNADFIAFG
ncbi:MAG: calcium-binding protein [Pseudomonadota bacterium]|nr:calcium-binding protein [Pseudomonadota bacterium]